MAKKQAGTPRSKVRAALRRLWLQSRERSSACKREKYTCEKCGAKQSRAKGKEVYIEVHHRHGIDWDGVIDLIFERLLVTQEELEVLCTNCHELHHKKEDEPCTNATKET